MEKNNNIEMEMMKTRNPIKELIELSRCVFGHGCQPYLEMPSST